MQGVLLTAGLSRRLNPVSLSIPKCLMPIGWNPDLGRVELLIEKLISQMKYGGANHIIVVVNHLKDTLMNFLGDGHRFEVEFTYIYQERLLGEADGLFLSRRLLQNTFFVADADNYINAPDIFLRLLKRHRTSGALATIGICKVTDARKYALVKLNNHFIVEDLVEKPNEARYWNNLAKMGIYVIEPEVLRIEQQHCLTSIGEFTTTELFRYLILQHHIVAGEIFDTLYADIGSWSEYYHIINEIWASDSES